MVRSELLNHDRERSVSAKGMFRQLFLWSVTSGSDGRQLEPNEAMAPSEISQRTLSRCLSASGTLNRRKPSPRPLLSLISTRTAHSISRFIRELAGPVFSPAL